jgi:hypothetical protein
MPRLKVVAHKKSGQLVKGYAELPIPVDDSGIPSSAPVAMPKSINITALTSGRALQLPIDSLKAIFFVRHFEGDPAYSETKFFNPEPKIEGLWVHLTFDDGEVTDGIIHNSVGFLNEPASHEAARSAEQ